MRPTSLRPFESGLCRTADRSAAFFLPYLGPGMRLLDCGCGVGSITYGLAEVVAPGHALGIDVQSGKVERARRLAAHRPLANLEFEVGSIYELPFQDASFDAVFAHTVVQHLTEPMRALHEIKRVLKTGGVVGIADDDHATLIWEPRNELLMATNQLLLRVFEEDGGDPYRARHHRRLLLDAGFARPLATATLGTVGVSGTTERTRAQAAWIVKQLRAPRIASTAIAERWVHPAQLDAMVAAVLAWGELPDAFFSLVGVAAVGWVAE